MKLKQNLVSLLSVLLLTQLSCYVGSIDACACQKPKIQLSDQYLTQSKECVIVIKCFAPWCPSCKTMESVFQQLSDEIGSAQCQFISVDIDQHDDFIERFGVKSVPTIIILQNQEVKEKLPGTYTVKALKDKIHVYLK